MRSISLSTVVVLAIVSAAHAQQSPEPSGDAIGHPPPLPGPPPLSAPESATQPAPATATPRASEPAPKGYTGAYEPAGTPPKPYSKGSADPGVNTTDKEKALVRAAPCSVSAQETDGFTTCLGNTDQSRNRRSRRR